ncbi:hypothetical protein FFLO_04981 [Filobasidium floriforme]|uniref:Polynucleotide 5'-hydroxyl-kinase GRC3 n=1 Tax=Filobasidium floriforme TaxID=5210 RepID=A0A8K0JJ18_9TREE|nr:hypothetical protein FFLO_04981 [Filobasidium floriforme]
MNGSTTVTYDLEAGMEWRFELEQGEAIAVRVTSEEPIYINYQEIPPNTWYPLYGDLRAAIWSPSPGQIEVSSAPSTAYTSLSSTFPFILSVHLALERRRILAKRNINARIDYGQDGQDEKVLSEQERGPRVMVLGPANSGKSTMIKGLLNLAVGSGMGWSPGVIGLDPGTSNHLVPGSVSLSSPTQAVPTHHPSHPLGSPPTTAAAMTLASDVPTLGWFVGSSEMNTSGMGKMCFPLWRNVVDSMAASWRLRCQTDEIVRTSGLLIDTPTALIQPTLGAGKGDKTRHGLVLQIAAAFEVDVVIVIGHEKLTIEMQKLLSGYGVSVISAPKSSGVVDLDDLYRSRIRAQQIKTYFYGEPALPPTLINLPGRVAAVETGLHPYSFTIPWDELEIYRVGEESAAPSSALPIGKQRILSATRLTRVNPAASPNIHRLQNAILGLVMVSDEDKRTDLPPRKVKEVKKEETKQEGDVKEEVKAEEGDDDEEEEEPIWKEEIGWREVCGFLTITKVDTAKRKFELLTPSPGKLPSRVALVGSVEWIEVDD